MIFCLFDSIYINDISVKYTNYPLLLKDRYRARSSKEQHPSGFG